MSLYIKNYRNRQNVDFIWKIILYIYCDFMNDNHYIWYTERDGDYKSK